MRVDARQAWFPPRGRLMHGFPPPSPQIPAPLPPARARIPPCAVGSRWHCATARPDDARAPPVHGRGRRPLRERGGRSRRWGGRLPRLPPPIRGRVRPCTTGSPPGVRGCWRLRQTADEWRTAVRDTGDDRGAPPRRTQAERALQDPKASRASAGAVRARPAGRFTRPGRGQAPGQPGNGLPECFARAGPPSRRRGAGP